MLDPRIRRYLRHGTLPQLRLFEASARLGSYTRAAEELHMSQPAASGQMRKLTETVGTPLFEQVGKKIHLTDAGRRLLEATEAIYRVLAGLEDEFAGLRTPETGQLRLAVSSSAMGFAPRLAGAFVELHPGVEASMQAFNREQLLARMAAGEQDLFLFAGPPDAEEVVAQELVANPLVVLARDDHPLAGVRDIPLARLAEEPFLVREQGSGTRRTVAELFRRRGLPLRIRMELGSNEAIKEAILGGMGVAVMARHTYGLDPESSRYACLDVEGFPLDNHWYLAWRSGRQLSAVAQAFLNFARCEARELALVTAHR
ncbi:MAG: LysR family transcriptional regulator [Burkholderiales bacterium]|nr:LysR family transcriptional regulator [Burkholderiales bacterium]